MADYATVGVAQGTLRGRKAETLSRATYYSFQGIPYAKPPTGPLRFKPPEPPVSWTGIRDALQEGDVCPQLDFINNEFIGDEDCLFINVYTPKLPDKGKDSPMPVMVWIHGGGFNFGSGNTDWYGPDNLMSGGVVVVTFNYRLGPFGFLSLGNEAFPGNMGLKDQVEALHWVQKNIAAFGGNPNNATIFGESAGAISVHLHMLSPMSKGLFHRAIVQSGTALTSWAGARSSSDKAFRLGEAMGCKTDDPRQLMEFLRDATPRQIVEAMENAKSEEEKRRGTWYTFRPCIEPVVDGEKTFLSEDPNSLVRDGKFHRVPFMVGINSHEGILMLKDVIHNPSLLKTIDGDFGSMVPKNLPSSPELNDKIKKFYFGSKPVSEETLLEYVHLRGDLMFGLPTHKTVKIQSALAPNVPIYYYQFCFHGRLNIFKRLNQGQYKLPGACHGDDIAYLFRVGMRDQRVPLDSPEMQTIRRMVKLWTNFAKTGNPTPELDEDVTVRWTPYTASHPCHLRIDTVLSLGGDVEKERMDFWEELYRAKM